MHDPFILLDDNRLGAGGQGLLFSQAKQWIVARTPEEVAPAFEQLTAAQKNGFYSCGFAAYELGYVLEKKLIARLPPQREVPLLYFGVFKAPQKLNRKALANFLDKHSQPDNPATPSFQPAWAADAYGRAFENVHAFLYAGDAYQVNLTFPIRAAIEHQAAVSLYARWRGRQRAAYGAYAHLPDCDVLSLSPELFFRIDDGVITAQPMKGTAARGLSAAEDAAMLKALQHDEKARAENLMIVDLMRNDISRMAEIGSVTVTELFAIKSFPTVHQMVSTITAQKKQDVGVWDVFKALFPCGSVTGAPKIRAMEIISDLERAPRGVYCGAIGYVAPDGHAQFNVAIRTLTVMPDGRVCGGVGGGLVVDSKQQDEYAECLLKAKFLSARPGDVAPFTLFETLRWSRAGGFQWLSDHLARLESSARYFGFSFDAAAAQHVLARCIASYDADCLRVRLSLDEEGRFHPIAAPFKPIANDALWKLAVSDMIMQSGNVFLYHKTSRRQAYDDEFAKATAKGFDEIIFLNERGEVTEGSRTTIFWREGARWFTPPLSAGVLPGILRAYKLKDGVQEKIITLDALKKADEVAVGNALRGMVRAIFV